MREDAFGLWWEIDPSKLHGKDRAPGERTKRGEKIVFDPSRLPEPPETDWRMPGEFPSLESANVIVVDIETHDPDLTSKGPGVRRDGYILGVAIATDTGFRGYYPIAHNRGDNFDPERVYSWLRVELAREKQIKLGAGILYDMDYLAEQGVWMKGPVRDVQIAEPLIDENARSYKLEKLSQKYLGRGKLTNILNEWGDRYFGKGQTIKNLRHLPANFVGPYAIEDCVLTLEVYQRQLLELKAQNLLELFDLECRLLPCILYMRRRGVRVDKLRAEEIANTLDMQAQESQKFINQAAEMQVDIWSGASLVSAFNKLSIPLQYDEKGSPIFQKGYLEKLKHPFVENLVTVRKLEKLNGTFIRGHILDSAIGDRIHCMFNQLRSDDSGAVSGRFSSSDPNLQNIPKRDPYYGPLIRSIFIADEGMQWWRADYEQIEPRITVHYSDARAASIREAYNKDAALDCYLAMLTNMPPGIDRDGTKTVYLGLTYNMGAPKLANQLGISKQEAEELYRLFHTGAPYIGDLKEKVIKRANDKGVIMTLLGRKRHFPYWEARDWKQSKADGFMSLEAAQEKYGRNIKRAWTYKALNALIQGSAADILKKAMVDVWESGLAQAGNLSLTVHDELDGSVDKPGEVTSEIKRIMEQAVQLRIPVLAAMSYADNWGACK